jgi:hypothetical protein
MSKKLVTILSAVIILAGLMLTGCSGPGSSDKPADEWTLVMQDNFTGNDGDHANTANWDNVAGGSTQIKNNRLECTGGANHNDFGGVSVKNFPTNSNELKITLDAKYESGATFCLALLDAAGNKYLLYYENADSRILLCALDSLSTSYLDGWDSSCKFNDVNASPGTTYTLTLTIDSGKIKATVHNNSNSEEETQERALSSDLPFGNITLCGIGGGQDSGGTAKAYLDNFKLEKR